MAILLSGFFWKCGLIHSRYFVQEATRQSTMSGSEHRHGLPFLPFGFVGVAGAQGTGDDQSAVTAAVCELVLMTNALFYAQCTGKGLIFCTPRRLS